nr:MAG TPA: hypothetical protein [Caudoviricetes sp.]
MQYSCNYPQKRRINRCGCPPLSFFALQNSNKTTRNYNKRKNVYQSLDIKLQ